MKSYIKYPVITFLITLWLVSCSEDFLENPPVGAFTEDNYIRNVDELETILWSCYSVLNTYYTEGPFLNMGVQTFIFGNIGSDDAEMGSTPSDNPYDLQDISLSKQLPGNEWVYFLWIISYDLIAKCNLVIDKAEEIPVSEDELEKVEQIVDQAKFLRAFGYFNMVTLFGDLPLIIHWLDDPNKMDFERSPKSQVWELIEQDLTDAANLPLQSLTEHGRATHGAVHALLGKAYMWQKKYDKAVEAFTAIIETGEYQLVDDYGYLHRYEGENCSESILEFQQELGVDGGDMFTVTTYFRLPREDGFGWGFDIPTQDLVSEFEPGDPRLLYTVNFIGDVYPVPWGQYVVENYASATGYTTRKAWIPWEERDMNTGSLAINWRYSRYAEVLLLFAEALNEEGQDALARTYLNMVRERARNTPKTDPQRISSVWDSTYTGQLLPDITTSDYAELRNAIWHEQRVELAQEGHRRRTLLRTERFKERMEAAKAALGCMVDDHELVLPIPGSEVENSQGRIIQNPGYN